MAIKKTTTKKRKSSKVKVSTKNIDKAIKETKKSLKSISIKKKVVKKKALSSSLSSSTSSSMVGLGIRKVVKKEARKKVNKGKYTLTIYMNDQKFQTKTDDIYKSLSEFIPTKITNKVIITLEEGKKYAEKIMMVHPARRTFSVPLACEFVAKNLILRLK